MDNVSQLTIRAGGCTTYRQQGYTPPTVSHFYYIAHVFTHNLQSRSTMEDGNSLIEQSMVSYDSTGIVQFLYSPEDRRLGSMTSDPEVGDVYLFTKQNDHRANGLFIVSSVEGPLTEIYAPSFRSIALIKCKYTAMAHGIVGLTHHTGPATNTRLFDVGYNFETNAPLVDGSGNEPTVLANGSLQFENSGSGISARVNFISNLSGLLNGGLRSDNIPQYFYINHGTVPNILYKHDSSWSIHGSNKLVITVHTNAGTFTRGDDVITL